MLQHGPLGSLPRQLGVIGYPVGHSVSPAMQNEAFRQQRMNCTYGAYAVEPSRLKEAVMGMAALGFLGANVTIPHKESIIPLLDEVAPTARQVGAVNTIVSRGGRLVGYNTDGWGFLCSLEEAGVKPAGLKAVVLGAGGAARAIAVHLALAGVSLLTISNRTPRRAEEVAAVAGSARSGTAGEAGSARSGIGGEAGSARSAAAGDSPTAGVIRAVEAFSGEERTALIDADLVINCTPLGMEGDQKGLSPIREISLLPQQALVYDTVYRPAQTRLITEAKQRGLRTVGGLGMLVNQGACAWEYWFGRRGPAAVMHRAALAALEGSV